MIFLSVSSRTSLPLMHMGGHHIQGDQQKSVTADGVDEVGHTTKWKAEIETGWKGSAVVDIGRLKQFKESRYRLTLAGCYQQIICLIWWKEPYLVASNSTRNRSLIWTCLFEEENLLLSPPDLKNRIITYTLTKRDCHLQALSRGGCWHIQSSQWVWHFSGLLYLVED